VNSQSNHDLLRSRTTFRERSREVGRIINAKAAAGTNRGPRIGELSGGHQLLGEQGGLKVTSKRRESDGARVYEA